MANLHAENVERFIDLHTAIRITVFNQESMIQWRGLNCNSQKKDMTEIEERI